MSAFERSKGLVKGLFWGGLIGLVIGILYTRKRDGGTWKDIGKSADKLYDKSREEIRQAQREMEDLVNREKDSSLAP